MANIVKWNDLDTRMGEILYEETYLKNEIKSCRPVEYLDITHMKFKYLDDDDGAIYETYPIMVRYTPYIRYWDKYPTPEERNQANWG